MFLRAQIRIAISDSVQRLEAGPLEQLKTLAKFLRRRQLTRAQNLLPKDVFGGRITGIGSSRFLMIGKRIDGLFRQGQTGGI